MAQEAVGTILPVLRRVGIGVKAERRQRKKPVLETLLTCRLMIFLKPALSRPFSYRNQ